MPRFRHVALGGTFDRFHLGHAALLATAFREGRRVSIGVTTDRFLASHPKPRAGSIQSYAARVGAVRRWIRSRFPGRVARLVPLNDTVGGAVAPDVDALVVSADTLSGGQAVNVARRRLGRKSAHLLVVPLVLAQDLEPVSSRRIRSGEIDARGARRSAISIGVALDDRRDLVAVAAGLRRSFPKARLHVVRSSGTRSGPPARRAVRLARSAIGERPLGFGVAHVDRLGWVVVERSPKLSLAPVSVRGTRPARLRRAVERLAAPSRAKPL